MSAYLNTSIQDTTTEQALEDDDDQALERFGIFAMVLYTLITACALIGNGLFCYVLLSSRGLRTVTYRLLFNLSLSDMLIALLSGAGHMTHTWIIQHWPFGEFCCYSFGYLQVLVIFASSYTLVVISFERYMSILHPLRTVIPRNNAGYIIGTIWLAAGLASIPEPIFYLHGTYEDFQPNEFSANEVNGSQPLHNEKMSSNHSVRGDNERSGVIATSEYETNDTYSNQSNSTGQILYCAPNPGEAGGHYYSLFICLFQYFIPVLVMGFCYAMVANTMWRSRNTLSGRENSKRFISSNKTQTQNQQNSFRYEDSARKQSMTRGGQKMIKMLIVVVACFSICWFPHEVYWVLKFPFPQLSTFPADPYIFTVFHMLALSHACFNPIICCWMNSSVRHGFMCTFGNIRLFRTCFPKTHWERYRSTKRNAMYNTNTEVVQCTVKRREGSRRSAFLTSENANNNVLKANRRISSNSTLSTAVSIPSFRSSYSGPTRTGSKRVVTTVNNASFRQE